MANLKQNKLNLAYFHGVVLIQGRNRGEMEAELENCGVLVLEDEKFSRLMLKKSLEKCGIRNISLASNGTKGLSILSRRSIEIIICDLNMPEMDGIEFLRHLASRRFAGDIILMSGEDNRVLDAVENLANAHKLKVLGTLSKPVTFDMLAILLGKSGGGGTGLERHRSQPVSPESLKRAMNENRLTPYYQPKVDTRDGRLVGVECLVRWPTEDGGMILPDAFIPTAEAHGMIDDLTRYVLETAVTQTMAWARMGHRISIAINVSMLNLKQIDCSEFIYKTAYAAGLDPGQIILEVTESQLMNDPLVPLEILTRLRLKGIGLSIDDFGTGYSSMEQLKSIPFTEMKIDRAFVDGASRKKATRAILEASVDLAKKLDMQIVAEGIEHKEDFDLVASIGVDFAQGYYIARPMSADAMSKWMVQSGPSFGSLGDA